MTGQAGCCGCINAGTGFTRTPAAIEYMGFRTVKLELEARLRPSGGSVSRKAAGKVERKSYGDSTERLRVSVKNLEVPDDATATVSANGAAIADFLIRGGSGRLDRESGNPGEIPGLQRGDLIEIIVDGNVILSGELYDD